MSIIERTYVGLPPIPPKNNQQRLWEFLAKLAMHRDVRFNGQFSFAWKMLPPGSKFSGYATEAEYLGTPPDYFPEEG